MIGGRAGIVQEYKVGMVAVYLPAERVVANVLQSCGIGPGLPVITGVKVVRVEPPYVADVGSDLPHQPTAKAQHQDRGHQVGSAPVTEEPIQRQRRHNEQGDIDREQVSRFESPWPPPPGECGDNGKDVRDRKAAEQITGQALRWPRERDRR